MLKTFAFNEQLLLVNPYHFRFLHLFEIILDFFIKWHCRATRSELEIVCRGRPVYIGNYFYRKPFFGNLSNFFVNLSTMFWKSFEFFCQTYKLCVNNGNKILTIAILLKN